MGKEFIKTQFVKPVYVCDITMGDCAFANKKEACELFPDIEKARECQKHLKAEIRDVNKEKRGGLTYKQIREAEPKLFEY